MSSAVKQSPASPRGADMELPKIHGPGMGRQLSYVKFVDLDKKEDRVMGLASGLLSVYPKRDDAFVGKFDDAYMKGKEQ